MITFLFDSIVGSLSLEVINISSDSRSFVVVVRRDNLSSFYPHIHSFPHSFVFFFLIFYQDHSKKT